MSEINIFHYCKIYSKLKNFNELVFFFNKNFLRWLDCLSFYTFTLAFKKKIRDDQKASDKDISNIEHFREQHVKLQCGMTRKFAKCLIRWKQEKFDISWTKSLKVPFMHEKSLKTRLWFNTVFSSYSSTWWLNSLHFLLITSIRRQQWELLWKLDRNWCLNL